MTKRWPGRVQRDAQGSEGPRSATKEGPRTYQGKLDETMKDQKKAGEDHGRTRKGPGGTRGD